MHLSVVEVYEKYDGGLEGVVARFSLSIALPSHRIHQVEEVEPGGPGGPGKSRTPSCVNP
jgi:hypothetical protein